MARFPAPYLSTVIDKQFACQYIKHNGFNGMASRCIFDDVKIAIGRISQIAEVPFATGIRN
jgi:hypothetical protein